MNEFDNISDSVLATYVDEYFRRAITEVRRYEDLNKQTVHLSVDAVQHYHDSEYTIKHNIQVGDSYSNDGIYAKHTSENLVRGAHLCVMRLVTDMQTPPKKYSAMLPAPLEPISEEELQLTTPVARYPFDDITQEDIDADAAEFVALEDQEAEHVSPDTGSGKASVGWNENDD